MSDKVNYSIVNTEAGNIAVRSTVKSFNLDHVTEKDIVSFYNHFSQYAAWDTGLLPVDGSGILSIRTAGIYTQFAYQHKPGLYHINWSRSEGSTAAAYYLAQPWRIIICDMKEGNLLGARMFYSPYPITNPSQQLYHVNLPNTNCKGYRNNGVGWQCLYQNEDWSNLPLNERIVRFIERCSGVETFNDGNMSETDGPRFYREHDKPEYLWNPVAWEEKSKEGYEWTLDESLWIPVLVKDKDNQKQHDPKGQPLTLADALVGDYRAYYYDDQETKPINAIIRPDKELAAKDVMQHFVNAYTSATSQTTHILNNTFESSQQIKNKKGSAEFTGSSLINAPDAHSQNSFDDDEDENEEDYFFCNCCEDSKHNDYHATDAYNNDVCSDCLDSNYIFIPSVQMYFSLNDMSITYSEWLGEYFHVDHDTVESCDCGEIYGVSGNNPTNYVIKVSNSDGTTSYCPSCVEAFASDEGLPTSNCHSCGKNFIDQEGYKEGFTTTLIVNPKYVFDENGNETAIIENQQVTLCPTCVGKFVVCPCGFLKNVSSLSEMNTSVSHTFISGANDVTITSCCASCTNINFDTDEPTIEFKPQNPDYKKYHSQLNSSGLVSGLQIGYKVTPGEPF